LASPLKDTYVSERENVNEDICAIGHGAHEIEVDLMQPVDIAKKARSTSNASESHWPMGR
jgi:hypothetical protein